MNDLSLVDINDLINEIFNRTDACIIGYVRKEDAGDPIIKGNWSLPGGWIIGVGLCGAIQSKIIEENGLIDE